jgi:PiT family inorganic phosphate transporter
MEILLIIVGILTLGYTFTNGFQDGSSVTATAIISRSMDPAKTVILVTACEFFGAIFGGSAVANTIQSITCYPLITSSHPAAGIHESILPVVAIGLTAAISWNYLTRYFKLPSSSTHALVGGILGSVAAATGSFKYIVWGDINMLYNATGVWRVLAALFISPPIGMIAGWTLFKLSMLFLRNATTKINKLIVAGQYITLPILSFAHGANDTQKSMGVAALCLFAAGQSTTIDIPLWLRIATGLAMVTGIIGLAPGIVKRVGAGIFPLKPIHALATQGAAAAVILTGSLTGGPVATSQVIASSVIGVGTAQRGRAVHWLVAADMLIAWVLTIPCSALLAAAITVIARQLGTI